MPRRCGIDASRNKLILKLTGPIHTGIPQNSIGTDKPGTCHSEPNASVTDLMRKKVEMAKCAQEKLMEFILSRIPTRGRVGLLAQEQYEQTLLGPKEELHEACCEMLDALKDVDLG